MPRKFFRKYLPDPDEVLAKPWAAPFRPWLGHPNLWHLNRHSVPKAVAIGLFCGLIPGPFQMLVALLMAIPLRSNVPVAMFVTFYTNPLTIVPLYLIAYAYGSAILGYHGLDAQIAPFEWGWSLSAFWQWMLSLGKPLGIGIVALALTLAVLGYFMTELAWRVYVVRAWRARRERRKR
ncbi:MAG: DUF2062 domain-containing protein [Betaproteobacteria bacterium]|nr:MAG: DUF2062 domain-containing protein [Betaproteobacteria bacterium]